MIKKVRKPGQTKIRTSAQASRPSGVSGLDRKRKPNTIIEPKKSESLDDDVINIDTIILE